MKTLIIKFPAIPQIIRYGVIGLLLNVTGYCLYIIVTYYWLTPKTFLSIYYPIVALLGFLMHGKLLFKHKHLNLHIFAKYMFIYALCYSINLFMLSFFTDMGVDHILVQGVAIPCIALIMFLGLKYFVFLPL